MFIRSIIIIVIFIQMRVAFAPPAAFTTLQVLYTDDGAGRYWLGNGTVGSVRSTIGRRNRCVGVVMDVTMETVPRWRLTPISECAVIRQCAALRPHCFLNFTRCAGKRQCAGFFFFSIQNYTHGNNVCKTFVIRIVTSHRYNILILFVCQSGHYIRHVYVVYIYVDISQVYTRGHVSMLAERYISRDGCKLFKDIFENNYGIGKGLNTPQGVYGKLTLMRWVGNKF